MPAVIDTNVILVANEAHPEVCPDCVLACVDRLMDIRRSGQVVIDDTYRILTEYQNKTLPRVGKRVGDAFIKWLLQNSANSESVHIVAITETRPNVFAEITDHALQAAMDPADRKFVAVAAAHPQRPSVWQATDCKWLDLIAATRAIGVGIDFLCKSDICAFYAAKFPGKDIPSVD